MLTSRGWWLLLIAVFLAALGTVISKERGGTLAVVGLTVIAWLLIEGINFHVGTRGNLPRLRVEREVRDNRGPVVTLWAGRTYEVVVRLVSDFRVSAAVLVDDRFPFGVELAGGGVNAAGTVAR